MPHTGRLTQPEIRRIAIRRGRRIVSSGSIGNVCVCVADREWSACSRRPSRRLVSAPPEPLRAAVGLADDALVPHAGSLPALPPSCQCRQGLVGPRCECQQWVAVSGSRPDSPATAAVGGKQRCGDLRGIGRGGAHSRRARSLLRCAVIGVKRQKPCQDDRWIELSERRLEHGQIAHEIVDRCDIAEPDCGKHSQAEINEGA